MPAEQQVLPQISAGLQQTPCNTCNSSSAGRVSKACVHTSMQAHAGDAQQAVELSPPST